MGAALLHATTAMCLLLYSLKLEVLAIRVIITMTVVLVLTLHFIVVVCAVILQSIAQPALSLLLVPSTNILADLLDFQTDSCS